MINVQVFCSLFLFVFSEPNGDAKIQTFIRRSLQGNEATRARRGTCATSKGASKRAERGAVAEGPASKKGQRRAVVVVEGAREEGRNNDEWAF
ncbi:hypothetical protein DPMN_034393 [Dreissena polymorpha]|uniref:Secreted protein n=1 Tax=Dreissena polymorpha TaxID=45954 RepID=A0A9D4RK18_DREPO|nr:hypothetical protein DPMN_034393 [Dreissena polymorpha]